MSAPGTPSSRGPASGAGTVELLAQIADVGVDPARGGWSRHAFTDAETTLREWFVEAAQRRGLEVERDHNANLWAWWRPEGTEGERAVATGSHLDSVPGGGAFDGPLGVVSAFAALDELRRREVRPRRPLVIACFAEEEGGRFGVACLGSRLLTGSLTPAAAMGLRDTDGVALADAARRVGVDLAAAGPDPARLAALSCFVELHVEQGRALVDLDAPVALATSVLAHGRWRLTFGGQGNHAGATPMTDRADPLLPAAATVLAARALAAAGDGSTSPLRATVGRLTATPGGTNVVASQVAMWLDARGSDDAAARTLVERVTAAARDAAREEGCSLDVVEEGYTSDVHFDTSLTSRLEAHLGARVPLLATGAGHDAAVLAQAGLATGMLFVRNPTGVSHAPSEHAADADCEAGALALADALAGLLT